MPTNSYNSDEPFDLEMTRDIYKEAKKRNDKRRKGTTSVSEFPDEYTREKRKILNSSIWNMNLPATHPGKDKTYETTEEAYRKLIFDAQFYLEDWERVKKIARRSPYITEF